MSPTMKSRLLATSAVTGIAIGALAAPATAQDAFGIHVDTQERRVIVVGSGETVEGDDIGIYADNGPADITVEDGGTVRGNGTNADGTEFRPSGGIVIAQPDSSVTNGGSISGSAHGITTTYFFGEDENDDPLPRQPLTSNTTVVNLATGTIAGTGGNGVMILGGGTVENDGLIRGTGLPNSTGVLIAGYPDRVDEGVTRIGTITNGAGATIEGGLNGVLLSGGGTIENAGLIRSLNNPSQGLTPFGIILSATADQQGREASLVNSGTVSGFLGLLVQGSLVETTIDNTGTIQGVAAGIFLNAANGTTTLNNSGGGAISGNAYAIRINAGSVAINNDADSSISAQANAIEVNAPGAVINNAGSISSSNYGVIAQSQPNLPLPTGTVINNSGSIIGQNNDAIRLAGGGTVTNSGTISGVSGEQSDGISMFPHPEQPNEAYTAQVINLETGDIYGSRYGVILSGGGSVDNAGVIQGFQGGVFIQGIAANSDVNEDRSGLSAQITNTGDIYGGQGAAVGLGTDLSTATLINNGGISSVESWGVSHGSRADLTIVNGAEGVIYGGTSGIYAGSTGTLTVDNAGTIIGAGTYDGFDAEPDAGITIGTRGSSVTNSGTIEGAGAGITTAYVYDADTDSLLGLAVGTTVLNSGTISGAANDGVRLIGGGSVTNSGTISGTGAVGADGISMYAFVDQPNDAYSAEIANLASGSISGARFGIALSGGGEVSNAGSITGTAGGILIQGIAANSAEGEDRTGLNAVIDNSGTISGASAQGDGFGVRFGSNLAFGGLINSGTIISMASSGVEQLSLAQVTVTNTASGRIEGGTSGIYSGSSGTLAVENAGTIVGNGTYDGFDAAPDAGITIATAGSSVNNSGTIAGAGAGITTAYLFDTDTNALVGLAVGTTVVNSGTITGAANDGVRLIGGGSVTNSGTISGSGSAGADGVSMFRFDDQAAGDYSASVFNDVGGSIAGQRYGAILSGGGSISNAGTMTGQLSGAVIQSQGQAPGQSALFENTGAVSGATGSGLEFNAFLDSVVVTNSGTIEGALAGVESYSNGTFTLDNSGTIRGGTVGVDAPSVGVVSMTNTGAIIAAGGPALVTQAQTNLVNSGVLSGGNGVAVLLGEADDSVTLRTGSAVTGAIDAGAGNDLLALEGDVLVLSDAQVLGAADNFESLAVRSGYWNTSGFVGAFDTVTIASGASLEVNEGVVEGETSIAVLASAVTNDGTLILDLTEDDIVDPALAISGTGNVVLSGEAVLTVTSDTLTYTGGTTVANGGLVLAGSLAGDVTTQGDGFFQLGNGGTEGTFSGDIVNDGRFVFNRSDDYDFEGAFSGSGVLDKYGAGTLTFLGDYSFTGVTNIFAGLVRIGGIIDPDTEFDLDDGGTLNIEGNDQTIGGLSGDSGSSVQLGSQTLTIEQEGNTAFGGAITGTGGITKDGEGTLNLTGDSTYTGPTAVNGGTLAVNGSIASNVTVNSGGTLGGNGSVGGATITNGGQLAPGNSIGRLTVAGDLAFAAGSTYEVEVNATGAADRVDATGRVTIASTARVAVLAASGNYAPRTDYIIITGTGGVTGTFGSVTTDMAFLDPLLRYGTNQITLSLYRNDIDFADVAVGTNQTGVAAAVQALGIDNPLFETVLLQNAATAQASFTDLSGEILASTVTGLTDDSRHLRNTLMAMEAPAEGGLFAWGSAFGGWGDFDGGLGLDTEHTGFVAGLGFGGAGFGVALSGGLGSSDFDLPGRQDRAEADSTFLALHGGFGLAGGFTGSAGISYAWHDIATSRTLTATGLQQTLLSDNDGNTLQLFGEVGYDLAAGAVAITPFARIAHVSTDTEGFTESGGTGALRVGGTEQDTTFLSLGARFAPSAAESGFQPYASAAWNRATGDRTARIVSGFDAGGPQFAVTGVTIPRDSVELEAGFEYDAGAFSIGAGYSGTLAGDRDTHGARITARLAF